MDVKDPFIPVRVPSQRPCCLFSPFFLSEGLQARTDSCPARIYENVFFYSHNNHTHISFLWNDILLNVDAAAQERDSSSIVVSRFTFWQKCCHNWSILCTRQQSDLLCKLKDCSKRQMMLVWLYLWLCMHVFCVLVQCMPAQKTTIHMFSCRYAVSACIRCIWSYWSAVVCGRLWGCNAQ